MMIHIANPIYDSVLQDDMNVEDEYFKALENRDTALMIRDKKLKEQEKQLKQNEAQLKQNEAQLNQQEAQLKAMVLLLSKSGMSVQQIANSVGMSQDKVKSLLES